MPHHPNLESGDFPGCHLPSTGFDGPQDQTEPCPVTRQGPSPPPQGVPFPQGAGAGVPGERVGARGTPGATVTPLGGPWSSEATLAPVDSPSLHQGLWGFPTRSAAPPGLPPLAPPLEGLQTLSRQEGPRLPQEGGAGPWVPSLPQGWSSSPRCPQPPLPWSCTGPSPLAAWGTL